MKHFIIADSGGTKTEWSYVVDGKIIDTFLTSGITTMTLSNEMVEQKINNELKPLVENIKDKIQGVYYYGTGCSIESNKLKVYTPLTRLFTNADVDVQHDMLGAARSVCLHKPGIAGIIGTGVSIGVYDGKNMQFLLAGIGYILGDEGSGAAMGKQLVKMFIYDTLDKQIAQQLQDTYKISKEIILDTVYTKPGANSYLASFGKFIKTHSHHPQIQKIIIDSFEELFALHITRLPKNNFTHLNFVGGIANAFQTELAIVCNKYHYQLGKVLRNPIEGLVEYHQ